MALSPQERAYRAAIKAQLEAQREANRTARSLARWQAARDVGASLAQASAYNPLFTQALVGVGGALLGTFGRGLTMLDERFGSNFGQSHFETVGEGMMGFAAAGAAADSFGKIADAFSRDSESKAIAFDLNQGGQAAAFASAPPDFPGPGGTGPRGPGGSGFPPLVPIPIPVPFGPGIPEGVPQGQLQGVPAGVPQGEPELVPIRDATGAVVTWAPQEQAEQVARALAEASGGVQAARSQRGGLRATDPEVARALEAPARAPRGPRRVVVGVEARRPAPQVPTHGAGEGLPFQAQGAPSRVATSRAIDRVGIATGDRAATARALPIIGDKNVFRRAQRQARGTLTALQERFARTGGVSPSRATNPRPRAQSQVARKAENDREVYDR